MNGQNEYVTQKNHVQTEAKKGPFHGEASPFMLRRHPDFLEFVLGDA